MRGKGQFDPFQIAALLLTVFAVAPALYPGFIRTHTGLLPVFDVNDFVRNGSLLWSPTTGVHWDPLRNGGPLAYAVAHLFVCLGAPAAQAVLISFAVGFIVGAWGAFGWVRSHAGSAAGLLAAVLYTYVPYHLSVVFVRGSLAEAWALAIWPLVFWSTDATVTRSRTGLPALALALFLLAAAHPGLAVLSLPLAALYAALIWTGPWPVRAVVLLAASTASAAIGHAAAGPLSAGSAFVARFPFLFQLLSPAWNPAGQPGDWLNPLPLAPGLPALGLAALTALLLLVGRAGVVDGPEKSGPPVRRLAWFGLGAALAGLLLVTVPSRPLWELLGWTGLVTFPWQVLGLVALGLSVAGGAAVRLDARLQSPAIVAGLVVFVMLAGHGNFSPRFFDFEIDFTPGEKLPHRYVMSPGQAPLAVFGDNRIALLDLRVEGPLQHGATVRLNVLWQGLQPLQDDYVVFVHALDEAGRMWGQRDAQPRDGKLPTTQWGMGEIVADRYELQIDPDGPRDGYRLEVGLYLSDTGERLQTTAGQNQVAVHDR